MEQRQPVLHALVLARRRHALVERIVDVDAAEGLRIVHAELANRGFVQQHLTGGVEGEALERGSGALRLRIEASDRLQRIAEEVEPHRRVRTRREDVDDAAAHREVARVHHRAGPRETVLGEEGIELVGVHPVARCSRKNLPLDQAARHHPLQDGRNGGQENGGLGRRLEQPRQRGQPARHDVGHRRDAVIGQAIPRREAQHLELGGEIGKLVGQHGGALVIDGNVNDNTLSRRLGDFRQQHGVEPFRHPGNGSAAGLGKPWRQL